MLKVVRLIDEEARLNERTSIAKRMLQDHEAIHRIMKYTGLSHEEIAALQSELDVSA
ncbi:MAG: hypothetical protein FWC89_02500 [Defluviitaleaceae bacterium]|nr:hypothetical protein [Defluviitaleaceae bacterium]